LINPVNSVIGTNFNLEPDYGSTTYQSSYQATLPAPFVSGAMAGYKASPVTFDITESPVTVKNQGGIETVSSVLGSALPAWDYNPAAKSESGLIAGVEDFTYNTAQSGYSAFKENPIQFAATSGFWAGVTIATEGIGSDLGVLAEGGSKLANAALSAAPYIKGGLALGFGAEAISQTTEGFTTYDPSQMGQNFGNFAESSIAPMIVGGFVGSRLYNLDVEGISSSARNIYESANFPETPSVDDFRIGVSEKASDVVYNFRQSAMGIENIGINSEQSYFSEPAFGSAGTFGDVPESGIFSTSTAIVSVPFERTISGVAYDIIDTNAQYNPDLSELTLSINRNLIQPSDSGAIKVVGYTNRAVLNTDVYAASTGIDLQLGDIPQSIAATDVFKTLEETDTYPSGRSYTRTISQKGRIEFPGTKASEVFSSRGITSGESVVAQKQMDAADKALQESVPKNRSNLSLSVTDIPRAISDLTIGYGKTSIGSILPIASRADVMQVSNRIVRAPQSADLMLQRAAEEIYGTSGGEGATPRIVQMGSEKTIFKTLSETGVLVSDRFGDVLGKRIGSIQTSENTFVSSENIDKMLYGPEASAFESVAARLKTGGVERIVKSGTDRMASVSQSADRIFQNPNVKTDIIEPSVKTGGATAALKIKPESKSTIVTSDILSQYSKLISGLQEKSQETARVEPSRGIISYAPRRVVFEEEEMVPSREALKRTGLLEHGAMSRKSAATMEDRQASVPAFLSISRTAITPMSESASISTQSLASISAQSIASITDIDQKTDELITPVSISTSALKSSVYEITQQDESQITTPAIITDIDQKTDELITPVSTTIQTPDITTITQIPDVPVIPGTYPVEIPKTVPDVPVIAAPYTFSGFGGSSVSKTWRKRIQLEIFGMGTDTRAVRALGINVPLPASAQIVQSRSSPVRHKNAEVNKGQNNIYGSNQRGSMFTMPSVRMPSRRRGK
jgi:hypothetical protein